MLKKIINLTAVIIILLAPLGSSAISEMNRLSGRFLLQSSGKIQSLWYVYPKDKHRYFIANNDEAVKVVYALGTVINNKTYQAWKNKAPKNYAGLILTVSDDKNKPYYVNPDSLKLIYLGDNKSLYANIKKQALAVKPTSLAEIPAEFNLKKYIANTAKTTAPTNQKSFTWKYKGKNYSLNLSMTTAKYNEYYNAQKFYKYQGTLPANWHNDYYAMFLKPLGNDRVVKDLALGLKKIATDNKLDSDSLIELAAAFVQSIPYDSAKAANNSAKPNYPYETLYNKLGICTDKSLLMVAVLRELGYGAALFDFDKVNHASAAVQCQAGYDTAKTGYCYIETTNYFPIGITPKSFSATGVISNKNFSDFKGQFNDLFSIDRLGTLDVFIKTSGNKYNGIVNTVNKVSKMQSLEGVISQEKKDIDSLKKRVTEIKNELDSVYFDMIAKKNSGDINGYNSLVPKYNELSNQHNQIATNYNFKIGEYNSDIARYNYFVSDFYSAQ